MNLRLADFTLFRRARSDEDDLCIGILFLDQLARLCHRRKIMGNMLRQLREFYLDIFDKSRAAGGRQKSFFLQFLCLLVRYDVCSQSYLFHCIESQLTDRRDDLSCLSVLELTCDSRCHDGMHVIVFIIVTVHDGLDDVGDTGHVQSRTERTLIHACSALDAFLAVDLSYAVRRHGNGVHFAGSLTRSLEVGDGTVRTALGAFAAFHALRFVDFRFLMGVNGDSTQFARIHTGVSHAPSAKIRHHMSCHRAFITCNVDDLDHIMILLLAAQRDTDTLRHDSSVLVNAAAHGRLALLDYLVCDIIEHRKRIISHPGLSRQLSQDLVL